jgi:hypothetical protein
MCKKHAGLRIDECAGCLIEKNNRLSRQLKHPLESTTGYWECRECKPEVLCRLTCAIHPRKCVADALMVPKWKEVKP